MSGLKLNVLIAAASPIPFTVIGAENGRDCARILATERVDVAFIDVTMPEMNGMDAVGVVRRAGNKTFVTLMSTNANKVRLQLARQLKVYEFLAKPFSREDVHAILRTYCRITVPSGALVVDDSATVRRIMRRVFDDSIFRIRTTEAGDGQTALSYSESCRYDVVFLDCNMPD
jgi:CheY-like chemotaxis protein